MWLTQCSIKGRQQFADVHENSRELDAESTARYIPPPVPVLQLAPLMVPPEDVVPVAPASAGSCVDEAAGGCFAMVTPTLGELHAVGDV